MIEVGAIEARLRHRHAAGLYHRQSGTSRSNPEACLNIWNGSGCGGCARPSKLLKVSTRHQPNRIIESCRLLPTGGAAIPSIVWMGPGVVHAKVERMGVVDPAGGDGGPTSWTDLRDLAGRGGTCRTSAAGARRFTEKIITSLMWTMRIQTARADRDEVHVRSIQDRQVHDLAASESVMELDASRARASASPFTWR